MILTTAIIRFINFPLSLSNSSKKFSLFQKKIRPSLNTAGIHNRIIVSKKDGTRANIISGTVPVKLIYVETASLFLLVAPAL